MARRRRRPACLAARADRNPDRRCRHARTLAHRLDAQPRPHDRRQFPDQASAAAVAARRGMVLGHAGGRRPRQQQRATGNGSPDAAPTPRRISGFSIRCCRAGNSTRTATMSGNGCRNSHTCPRKTFTRRGTCRCLERQDIRRRSSISRRPGCVPCSRSRRSSPADDAGRSPRCRTARGRRRARRRARLRGRRRDGAIRRAARRPDRRRAGQRRGAAHHVRPDRRRTRAVPARQPRVQAVPRARRAERAHRAGAGRDAGAARRAVAPTCRRGDRPRPRLGAA